MQAFLLPCTRLLALVILLAACGSSPPSRHYVLTARHAATPSGEIPSLGIGPITVPEYLNRSGLVYNQQGNQLQVSGTERWAEPLEDGLQRVISLNLAALVGTQNIRFFPWNAGRPPDYAVKVNLLGLGADDRAARLVAEWLVYRPGDAAMVQRRISQLEQPLAAGALSPEQIAPAYSELLYQLSEVIAQTIIAAEAERAAAASD